MLTLVKSRPPRPPIPGEAEVSAMLRLIEDPKPLVSALQDIWTARDEAVAKKAEADTAVDAANARMAEVERKETELAAKVTELVNEKAAVAKKQEKWSKTCVTAETTNAAEANRLAIWAKELERSEKRLTDGHATLTKAQDEFVAAQEAWRQSTAAREASLFAAEAEMAAKRTQLDADEADYQERFNILSKPRSLKK